MIRLFTTGLFFLLAGQWLIASSLSVPKRVQAGQTFMIRTEGSGEAHLYIIGPGGVTKQTIQLGAQVSITPDEISNAGCYTAFLIAPNSSEATDFDVVSAPEAATLSFLARPSRLSVGLHGGIGGVAYIFDAYHNMILESLPVRFQLSLQNAAPETRAVNSHFGVAWTQMDSSPRAGSASFQVSTGSAVSLRILQQVPGDACQLRMSAHSVGDKLHVETEPLRDCTGNLVADGTIVRTTNWPAWAPGSRNQGAVATTTNRSKRPSPVRP